MESERCSQQELGAGIGSFFSCGGLAIQVTLNHHIAQGWLLHVTNRDSNSNLPACGSNEPYLVLEKEVR